MSGKGYFEYENCHLCPRECGVDRILDEKGVCGESDVCRVAFMGAHFGEEPPISGRNGSGTVFFSGCSSQCFFCQNEQISRGGTGFELGEEKFAEKLMILRRKGVHNINFVTPDHFWPHIEAACKKIREVDSQIPFLFNSSGYQRPDMIFRYAEWMDIFLPDFKFLDKDLAKECMGDENYGEIAFKSLKKMVEIRGFLSPWDDLWKNPAEKGVLVRHLVLPGHTDDSCAILKRLFSEFGAGLPLSVMSQYHPVPLCQERGLLTGRVTVDEYERVCDCVHSLGFEHVFIQEGHGDDEFIPDFEKKQPFQDPAVGI